MKYGAIFLTVLVICTALGLGSDYVIGPINSTSSKGFFTMIGAFGGGFIGVVLAGMQYDMDNKG
jgi:hypothetical protein